MDVKIKEFVDDIRLLTAEELAGSLIKDFKIRATRFRFEGADIAFKETLIELLERLGVAKWT